MALTAVVHMKVVRTALYDIALTLNLPGELVGSGTVRRHLKDLPAGALSTECTDAAFDRITDAVLVDVIDIVIQPTAKDPSLGGSDVR